MEENKIQEYERAYSGAPGKSKNAVLCGKMLITFVLLSIIFKIIPGMFMPRGYSAVLSSLLAFGITFLGIYRGDFNLATEDAFQRERAKQIKFMQGVQDYFFAVLSGALITWGVALIADYFRVEIFFDTRVIPNLAGFEGILFAIYSCVIAPIIFEIMFRGVFFKLLMEYGKNTAIFVSALLYGLLNGYFALWIISFFVGVAMANTRIRCKSLKTVIKISVFSSVIMYGAVYFTPGIIGWIFIALCGFFTFLGAVRFVLGKLVASRKKEEPESSSLNKNDKYILILAGVLIIIEDIVYMLI